MNVINNISIFNIEDEFVLTTTKIASRYLEQISDENWYGVDIHGYNKDSKEIVWNCYRRKRDNEIKEEVFNIDEILEKVSVILIRDPFDRTYSGFLHLFQDEYFNVQYKYRNKPIDNLFENFRGFKYLKYIDTKQFFNPINLSVDRKFTLMDLIDNPINKNWNEQVEIFLCKYIEHLDKTDNLYSLLIKDNHTSPYLSLFKLINEKYNINKFEDISDSKILKKHSHGNIESLNIFKNKSIDIFHEKLLNFEDYKNEMFIYQKILNT